MIEFNESGLDMVRGYVAKAAAKHGFADAAVNFIKGRNNARLNMRANMFLCIGMNSSGQTITMNNVYDFVKKGTNRFFLSLKNRWELSEDMFKQNLYKGKYNLACDYYVARAVFDCDAIPAEVIDEWDLMMKPLIIKDHHGVKMEVVHDEEDTDDSAFKYRWVDRFVPTKKSKKK